jgi:nocturnin
VIATSEASTSPDVVCLQEVDQFQFFEDELRKHGYRGVFKEDPWSPCRKFGAPNDGVAIFYKVEKLELLSTHAPGAPRSRKDDPTTNAGKTLMARFRMKRQVKTGGALGGLLTGIKAAATVVRNPVFTGVDVQEVVVVAAHLEGAKTVDGIITRLEQTKELCRTLNDFATNLCADVDNVQIIIAGDLNATPNEACVVHLRGRGMRSAYEDVGAAVGDKTSNQFTTWKTRTGLFKTGEVKHTIDYILYSAHRGSKVVSVAKLPNEDDVPSATGLPTFGFPSDHLPLQARILL